LTPRDAATYAAGSARSEVTAMAGGGSAGNREVQLAYTFSFADGSSRRFALRLDYDTLAMLGPERKELPAWTALSFCQCPNCPLDPAVHPRCPVAANLVDVVDVFKESVSYEEVDVSVEAHGRSYVKRTSLQQAASSLIGIFMVTSGCPILNRLRPMVDTHLPFMDADESTYRMISTYLMAQFFRHKAGQPADWELKDLLRFLSECRETNTAFCRRLQALGVRDASLNAMSILNALGEITSLSIEKFDMSRWERIFAISLG
jgi:Domain of unknown function (DUF6901)